MYQEPSERRRQKNNHFCETTILVEPLEKVESNVNNQQEDMRIIATVIQKILISKDSTRFSKFMGQQRIQSGPSLVELQKVRLSQTYPGMEDIQQLFRIKMIKGNCNKTIDIYSSLIHPQIIVKMSRKAKIQISLIKLNGVSRFNFSQQIKQFIDKRPLKELQHHYQLSETISQGLKIDQERLTLSDFFKDYQKYQVKIGDLYPLNECLLPTEDQISLTILLIPSHSFTNQQFYDSQHRYNARNQIPDTTYECSNQSKINIQLKKRQINKYFTKSALTSLICGEQEWCGAQNRPPNQPVQA